MMASFFCFVFLGVLAVQVRTQGNGLPNPTDDSSSHLATTTEAGFFRRLFNAARDMVSPVQHNASTTTNTPGPSSLAASPHAHLQFMQEPELKEPAQVNFSLRFLNADLSVAKEPYIYEIDSHIYMAASVQTSSSMLSPKIFIDKCYGTDTKELIHPKRLFVIADNHGCLYAEETVTAWLRKNDSTIVFTMPAFPLTGESDEQIYIHCLLTAWSQKIPTTSGKKTCYFSRTFSKWENIDEPFMSSVCNCCDSVCRHHGKFKASFVGEGRLHKAVAGPLTLDRDDFAWFWFTGRCYSTKTTLLIIIASLSGLIALVFTIASLILVVKISPVPLSAMARASSFHKEHQLLMNERMHSFDTELKTMAGALAARALEAAEETEESNLDYRKLKGDTPDMLQ